MRIFYITLLLFIGVNSGLAQDSRPNSVGKLQYSLSRSDYERDIYRGIRIHLTSSTIFRLRTYSYDAVQATLIIGHPLQLRVYGYFNFPEYTLTPAISLRYYF